MFEQQITNNMANIDTETIERFLGGRDPQPYITAIEVPYYSNEASLIINHPERGKSIEKHKFRPFVWMKHDVSGIIYGGNRVALKRAMNEYGIKFKSLKTEDETGYSPRRLENGYKYIASTNQSYSKLLEFFENGGIKVYNDPNYSRMFQAFSPTEQFMIQTGKRLFKGMEDYDDIHRFQFDLETTGLIAETDYIFKIGMSDNKGWSNILTTTGDTPQERRDSERLNIQEFFREIIRRRPDTVSGYYSENFDWDFIERRCDRLGVPMVDLAIALNGKDKIKRRPSTLKLGSKSEHYIQTYLWGFNIMDISHPVRRAMEINSNIKAWGLKYITKFSKVHKPNRVYIPGKSIYSTWADKENDYWFDDGDGTWGKIKPDTKLESGMEIVSGDYIVERYLLDDLWETDKVDTIYNQAAFLLAKILPTSYMRSSTMGTAGQWTLLLAAWSYENNLAIPEYGEKVDFTGGLSRLLETGFAVRVVKLDFAALYPKTTLTWDIFPDLDISHVMKGLLTYIVSTRDKYKFLTGKYKLQGEVLKEGLKEFEVNSLEYQELNAEIIKLAKLESDADKKQLPLKILANSFFGSYGAPNIFPWGDTPSAERITCMSRQNLRLMVEFFSIRGFRPLVGDSVTFDTPIYIKWKKSGELDILPICDIYNETSESVNEGGLRDLEIKPYEVLTVNGWKEINYVYRHKTNKKIHRVSTKDKLICVTEDHSLFQNGKQIKPSELNRGDLLDVRDIPNFNREGIEYLDDELCFLYGYFLGDGSSYYGDRKQFYKSKKTGEININKGKRSIFKISSSNYDKLVKLKEILEEQFLVKSNIKDHRESSGVYNLVSYSKDISIKFSEDFYTSYREKKIPHYILNATNKHKEMFLEGVFSSDGYGDTLDDCSDIGMKSQVAMSGIGYLMDCLNIDKKIRTRKDKENFISFKLKNRNRNNSSFTHKTKMKSGEVWLNEIIENKCSDGFVYDISTEDGTFIGGIGGVDLKNTDGFNFAVLDEVDNYRYTPTCNHWKTEDYDGTELQGVEAVVAEFNEVHMKGWMGLDVDDICEATINFKRKNYANLINGKVKLVGNSIKSKKMPTYIEEFLNIGIPLLLHDKGYEFIQEYYKEVDRIYNYEIPIVKIASKGKVSETLVNYEQDCKTKTKSGSYKARKAHMELVKYHELTPNIGDVIYYVNTGQAKSTGDVQVKTDKATGKRTININCKHIPESMLEENPDLTTDEYNAPRYITALNKKIAPLLVCFSREIRDSITIETVKDRKLKEYVLKSRNMFTENQCKLVNNQPIDDVDQDRLIEDFITMEDKEIRFWDSVNEVPHLMDKTMWEVTLHAYKERELSKRRDAINAEKVILNRVCKELELKDLSNIEQYGKLPKELLRIAYVDVKSETLKSNTWDVQLAELGMIFKYKEIAEIRERFYTKGLLYLTRDRSKTPLTYWNKFLDKIRDSRFDWLESKDVLNYWIDTAIGMGYDSFMELDEEGLYELWVKCYELHPIVGNGLSEIERYENYGKVSTDTTSLHSGDDIRDVVSLNDREIDEDWGF